MAFHVHHSRLLWCARYNHVLLGVRFKMPIYERVTVKMLRIARITMLQAIVIGDSDVAYSAARNLAHYAELYLWQNASRFMPRV